MENTKTQLSVSLTNKNVCYILATIYEGDYGNELIELRKAFFSSGKAKIKKNCEYLGCEAKISGSASKHSLRWKKTAGKIKVEEAFNTGRFFVVVRRDLNGNICGKIHYDRDLRWTKTEYFLHGDYISATAILKPLPSGDSVELFTYNESKSNYESKILYPLAYKRGTAEQSLLNSKFGEPAVILVTDEGEYSYCEKKEQKARLKELEDIKAESVDPKWQAEEKEEVKVQPREKEPQIILSSEKNRDKADKIPVSTAESETKKEADLSELLDIEEIPEFIPQVVFETKEPVKSEGKGLSLSDALEKLSAPSFVPVRSEVKAVVQEDIGGTITEDLLQDESQKEATSQNLQEKAAKPLWLSAEPLPTTEERDEESILENEGAHPQDEPKEAQKNQRNSGSSVQPEAIESTDSPWLSVNVLPAAPQDFVGLPDFEEEELPIPQAIWENNREGYGEDDFIKAEESTDSPISHEDLTLEREEAEKPEEPFIPETTTTIIADGERYEYTGKLINGKREGRGRTAAANGVTIYEGDYSGGMRNGFGVSFSKSGELSYAGFWKDDRKTELGVSFREADHAVNICRRTLGKPESWVSLYDSKGVMKFSGIMQGTRKTGLGMTVNSAKGTVLVGKYTGGDKPVKTAIFDLDGSLLYYGETKDEKRNGQGTEFDKDGAVIYSGEWKDDKYFNGVLYKN